MSCVCLRFLNDDCSCECIGLRISFDDGFLASDVQQVGDFET